jgi:hypothetical protein
MTYKLAIVVYLEVISQPNRIKEARTNLIEELNDVYSSPTVVRVIESRRMRWAKQVARMEEERGVSRILVGNPEGKRRLGRHRPSGEDNIKAEFQEVGCGVTDWIELAQDKERWRALMNAVMDLRVP